MDYPARIGSFKPYKYQRRAWRKLDRINGCGGLLMEMGTGKTPVSLGWLYIQGVHRVLVICPIGVIGVWRRELRKMELPYRVINLTTGTIRRRAQRGKAVAAVTDVPIIAFCNYESYWREPLRSQIRAFKPEAIIADEAHRLKGRSTKQSRFAGQLAVEPSVKHRLALTGTPIGNGLQDLFGIYRFADPKVFGTTYSEFEARYIVKGGFYGYEITGYRNENEAAAKVAASSFQIGKREALDLPPVVDVVVPVHLSAKTRKAYHELTKHAIAEVSGLGPDGKPLSGRILAQIVLNTILRKQQLTSGLAGTDAGLIDLGSEKLDVCTELLSDIRAQKRKAVVICKFTRDIERLATAVPGAMVLSGSVKQRDRDRIQDRFASDSTADVVIIQICLCLHCSHFLPPT